MAVLKMKRVNIYALKKHRKAILEELQRSSAVEVTDLKLDGSVFHKEETAQKRAVFIKSSSVARQAYEILDEYFPEKKSPLSMFEGRKPISVESYYEYAGKAPDVMTEAYSIISLKKDIADNKAEISKYENQIEALKPWREFDISMRFKGTAFTSSFIGTLPEPMTYEEIMTALISDIGDNDGISLEIVSTSDIQTCIFVLCSKKNEEAVFDALRNIGFAKPPVAAKYTPMQRIEELNSRIDAAKKKISDDEKKLIEKKDLKDKLRFTEDYYVMRSEKYEVIEQLENTKHTFLLTGYVIAENADKLAKRLEEKYCAAVEIEEPSPKETPPVALKNKKLVRPVESVLETYSLPKKGEVDPTGIMAIFYYIFFGLMFSDAGYGLVMTLGCAFVLHKFKNMEDGLKKSVQMFLGCGIFTMFWGFMFGSFFGDAISVIGKTFFGADISLPPVWFNPVEGTNSMTLLMVAFLMGIIHLFVGLGIQGYMHIKNGKPLYAVYDVLSWYLLVGGGILALLSMDMLKSMTGFVLPPIFMTIGGICAAVGAVLILLFSGRGSSPIKRLLKGVYGLYGVTSYLSDILSYSRLLALGLATGVIAQVFNQIGAMFGGGFGAIPFAIVFIIGHTLNIGINALGAYVHTNRLQFVEFFGKFYEGGGEKFKPFTTNTKYYKIKEDISNG